VEEGTVSESLSNAFELLEDINIDQYGALLDIYLEMRKLNANISGLATSIVRTGAIGQLELPSGVEGTFFKNLNVAEQVGGLLGKSVDAALGFLGTLTEIVGGFLFGGDVSFETLAAGIGQYFQSGVTAPGSDYMGNILGGTNMNIRPYLWYERTEDGGWLGEDDKQKKFEWGEEDLPQVSKLVTDVVRGIGESMLDLVEIFGLGQDAIDAIMNYQVELGLLDLKNLNAEEVQEAVSAWFSNFADEMAGEVFGDLITQYQKASEGLFETAIRLAVELETVKEVFDMTGQTFKYVGEEAVHFSQALIEAAGSMEALLEDATTYFEEYFTEAEKLVWLNDNLADSYKAIGVEMPLSRNEFKNLMASIDLTTDSGQELYVALLAIAGATDAYYDALEAANQKIIDAQRLLTGTTDQGSLSDIENRYGWDVTADNYTDFIEKFISMSPAEIEAYAAAVGVSTEQLVDDILTLADIFDYLGDGADDAATAISRIDFAALRDQITGILGGAFGGANSAAQIMSQIVDIQSIPMDKMTGDNLLAMSEKLVQWYNAAAAELQKAAQEEQAAANLLIQVSDRLESLITTIDSTIRSIKYSDLNLALPQQKADDAQGDYAALLIAAQSGGTAEVQEYLGFAQTYLQQQQNAYKSSETYQGVYDTVMADMEAIKEQAGSGGYDAAILAELKRGNEQIEADLSGIQATFSEFEAWILNALNQLEVISVMRIIWESDWSEAQQKAISDLLDLVNEHGWDYTSTLEFIGVIPMDLFEDLNELATMAGWIADESGGWNSKATISFLKNIATNWDWENIDDALYAAGWVKEQAGSWTADATIAFIAGLFDNYGVSYDGMAYWLEKMGVGATQIPAVMAKIIMQAYQGDGMAINDIDDYLTNLGITDKALSRSIEVNLIYNMHASGDVSVGDMADWSYVTLAASGQENQYEAYQSVQQVVQLMSMFGTLSNYANVGSILYQWSAEARKYLGNVSDLQRGVYHAFTHAQYPYHFAEGGLVTSPTYGLVGEAGYPEAIIPMKDGINIPVKWVNGGSTQAGATGEEVALLKELIDVLRAKDTAPKVNVNVDAQGIIQKAGQYVSEKSRRGTLDVRSH
ncbi:MAG: hypothetical protein HN929_12810, partial [Chloroflexi bacterium]|nr:hypothetical protein [Chloroflexota bacterium]